MCVCVCFVCAILESFIRSSLHRSNSLNHPHSHSPNFFLCIKFTCFWNSDCINLNWKRIYEIHTLWHCAIYHHHWNVCAVQIHEIIFEWNPSKQASKKANERLSEITHNLSDFINNNQIINTQWFNSYQLIIMLFSIIYIHARYECTSLSPSQSLLFADINREEEREKTRTTSTSDIQVWYVAFRYVWFHYSHLFVRELDYICFSFVDIAIDIDRYSFRLVTMNK